MHEERRDRGSVAAGVVSGALRYARSRGADADTLATAAATTEQLLADPDARVPLASHLRLLRAAAAELRDPAFALHLGADVGMAEVSVLGLVMEASATMGEALVPLQRYGALALQAYPAAAGGPPFEAEHDGDRLLLVDRRPGGTEPELVEEAVARLVCGPRRFLAAPHVLAVDVPHPRPGHGAEYERVLGCPVRFDTGRTALTAAPAGGELAGRAAPALRVRCAAGAGEALLSTLSSSPAAGPARCREQVEDVLRAVVHQGDPGADAVAARLRCSRSTLFRRLREEGTSYRQVLDDLRRELATSYLQAGRVSVAEVAYLVGFFEAAAFTRTFRRWTGTTPGAYRALARRG
ncbi:AraC family transcriptional regulator ligand-binding domain-containing protein [Kineococcus endophyticus]|uniref:AraC family transcriptional regulator ligand-binding domain-containing protein n=1 Tax=Kineococcus endophyticus TaxID=1181883 RepID=A0ABV3PB02_9ACTN